MSYTPVRHSHRFCWFGTPPVETVRPTLHSSQWLPFKQRLTTLYSACAIPRTHLVQRAWQVSRAMLDPGWAGSLCVGETVADLLAEFLYWWRTTVVGALPVIQLHEGHASVTPSYCTIPSALVPYHTVPYCSILYHREPPVEELDALPKHRYRSLRLR